MELTLEQGKEVVAYARRVLGAHFGGGKPEVPDILADVFAEDRGVFVTLKTHPGENLRGCIGFPEPVKPLGLAVEEAAVFAATDDPRFPPVKGGELEGLTVEVSVLTPPQLIEVEKPTDYPKHVVVGRDGLIVRTGYTSGLLLPQVPVEWGWGTEEFLSHTCTKAGLPPDCWLDPGTKIYKFAAQVFSEKEPGGEVVWEKLTA